MIDDSPSTRIKKLSPLLINQLAAGEVVTRPAAVVKELLENAIDAEATEIDIHITQGGMGMIQVCDNGTGIYPEDMVMAITRHATSKVADIGTLQGIRTLGFRGEALAAIAAVSRLQLISSHNDEGIGRQLQVAGVLADTPSLTPVVHGRGTTVTIKDLYFNVPARRGNLKSVATEFAHIEAMVREVALARSDIRIHLTHDHKKRLLLAAQQDSDSSSAHPPLSRLEQALEMPLSTHALPLMVDLSSLLSTADAQETGQARIDGWLFLDKGDHTTLPKLLYINGRLVKEPIISNHLRQLTEQATGYALYFQLPAHWLNLNVHPSKQRIKIGSISNILAHLGHAVRGAVQTMSAHNATTQKALILANANASTEPAEQNTVYQKTIYQRPSTANDWANTDSDRAVQAPTAAYHTKPSAKTDQQNPAAFNASIDSGNLPTSETIMAVGNAFKIRCLGVVNALPEHTIQDISAQAPCLLLLANETCCLLTLASWQSMTDMPQMQDKDADILPTAQAIEAQIKAALTKLPSDERKTQQQTLWQQIEAQSSAVLSLPELTALMLQHTISALDTAE